MEVQFGEAFDALALFVAASSLRSRDPASFRGNPPPFLVYKAPDPKPTSESRGPGTQLWSMGMDLLAVPGCAKVALGEDIIAPSHLGELVFSLRVV